MDLSTGLPTFNRTHEIAQQVAPESRVVYVDNDPSFLTLVPRSSKDALTCVEIGGPAAAGLTAGPPSIPPCIARDTTGFFYSTPKSSRAMISVVSQVSTFVTRSHKLSDWNGSS